MWITLLHKTSRLHGEVFMSTVERSINCYWVISGFKSLITSTAHQGNNCLCLHGLRFSFLYHEGYENYILGRALMSMRQSWSTPRIRGELKESGRKGRELVIFRSAAVFWQCSLLQSTIMHSSTILSPTAFLFPSMYSIPITCYGDSHNKFTVTYKNKLGEEDCQ